MFEMSIESEQKFLIRQEKISRSKEPHFCRKFNCVIVFFSCHHLKFFINICYNLNGGKIFENQFYI